MKLLAGGVYCPKINSIARAAEFSVEYHGVAGGRGSRPAGGANFPIEVLIDENIIGRTNIARAQTDIDLFTFTGPGIGLHLADITQRRG